ncbi:MAG: dUTPase [Candidatus Brocadiia bacterium]
MDKLDSLFRMQAELNEKTFAKNDLCNPGTGRPLTMADFRCAVEAGQFEKGGIVDLWLQNYARALAQETCELVDSTPWKWWSKDRTVDIQNARVEIVDALHFWLSLAMVAGMDADDVHRLYTLKNKVNHDRQDSGAYSRDGKDEKDNEKVK